jgi:hypothetical protein
MPNRSNTARSTLTPPPSTGRRSSFRPSSFSCRRCPPQQRSTSQSSPSRVTTPGGPAVGGQHVGHRAHGARRAVGHGPQAGRKGVQRLVEHRLGRDLGGFSACGVNCPRGSSGSTRPRCPAGTTPSAGGVALAQDHLGGAPADVDHQPALVGLRQQVRDPLVDQARLFVARHHLDAESPGWPAPCAGNRRGCALRAGSGWPRRAPAACLKPCSRSAKRARQSQPRCMAARLRFLFSSRPLPWRTFP